VDGPPPPAVLNAPVVGMTATSDGKGYWLVAGDGGIFTFGDSQFYGSTGAIRLNKPVIGMAATPDGRGYWLLASDGGIFSFGDAQFYGSAGGLGLRHPAVGMAVTPDGHGYWLVTTAGQVFAYGDAGRYGDALSGPPLAGPTVGIAATSDGAGYWLATSTGRVLGFGDASLGVASPATTTSAATTSAATTSAATTSATTITTAPTAASVTTSAPVDAPVVAVAAPGPPPMAARAVAYALAQVGTPYVYGGTGPAGFDCSGLVMQAYASAGVTLPRVAENQYNFGPRLAAGTPLQPGDVVFFGTPTAITHDGIYIGNGMMVDAPHAGADVRVESYLWSDFVGASRPAGDA